MDSKEYTWRQAEDEQFIFYAADCGNDYLCVYADKKYPDIWMGYYIRHNQITGLMDGTFNDVQMEAEQSKGIIKDSSGFVRRREVTTSKVLTATSPEAMKDKVIYAYENLLRYLPAETKAG